MNTHSTNGVEQLNGAEAWPVAHNCGGLPAPLIVADVETSHLDPARGSVLSLGAVRWDGTEFYDTCAPWAGAAIDPAAMAVNGFDPVEVHRGVQSEAGLVVGFLEWVNGPFVLCGMNPGGFDVKWLVAALARAGLSSRWLGHRSVDMHSLAVACALRRGIEVPDRGFSTDRIYAMLGMPPEPKPHNALTGARMEAAALKRMLEWTEEEEA
jgi:hypothetical protein